MRVNQITFTWNFFLSCPDFCKISYSNSKKATSAPVQNESMFLYKQSSLFQRSMTNFYTLEEELALISSWPVNTLPANLLCCFFVFFLFVNSRFLPESCSFLHKCLLQHPNVHEYEHVCLSELMWDAAATRGYCWLLRNAAEFCETPRKLTVACSWVIKAGGR